MFWRPAILLMLCATAWPVNAEEASTADKEILGAWQLSEACKYANQNVSITEVDGNHVVMDGRDCPVIGLAEDGDIVTRPFQLHRAGSTDLWIQLKGPDGLLGNCHYVRAAQTQTQP